MSVWAFRRCGVFQMRRVALVAAVSGAFLHQLPFGFLLSASLLLPQELLGLQKDSGIDATSTWIAIPGALVAGVPGVVLSSLETFSRWVSLFPRVLGDGARVLPWLPWQGAVLSLCLGERVSLLLPLSLHLHLDRHRVPTWLAVPARTVAAGV